MNFSEEYLAVKHRGLDSLGFSYSNDASSVCILEESVWLVRIGKREEKGAVG